MTFINGLKASFVLFFFSLTLVQHNAVESPDELYWNLKLGNITMPKVLKDSLQHGSNDGIVKHDSRFQILQDKPIKYIYPYECYVQENPIPQDGRVGFFTNEKLLVGTKMKLHFNPSDDGFKFLPLYVTKSMTIASNKLQEILDVLSISPKSVEAKYITKMLKQCELKGIEGEVRYCAPSLQAMIDFITSNSSSKNTKIVLASTEEENETLMEYTIQKAQKISNLDKNNCVCHKLMNPFAVFLCHTIRNTDIYSVSLVDANGKEMNAVSVCHKDTSKWYPGHDSFKILKIKPGEKPICHFLSGDAVVWIRNYI